MNKIDYLISLLPKAGVEKEIISNNIQELVDAGEEGEALAEAAAILNKQETVPEEVEHALRDAAECVDEDVSEWYTWRFPI